MRLPAITRTLAAGGLLGVALPLGLAPTAAIPAAVAAADYGGFGSSAWATPIRVEVYEPSIPVPAEPQLETMLGYTKVLADSGTSQGKASYLWPGDPVGDGLPAFGAALGLPKELYENGYPVQVNSSYPTGSLSTSDEPLPGMVMRTARTLQHSSMWRDTYPPAAPARPTGRSTRPPVRRRVRSNCPKASSRSKASSRVPVPLPTAARASPRAAPDTALSSSVARSSVAVPMEPSPVGRLLPCPAWTPPSPRHFARLGISFEIPEPFARSAETRPSVSPRACGSSSTPRSSRRCSKRSPRRSALSSFPTTQGRCGAWSPALVRSSRSSWSRSAPATAAVDTAPAIAMPPLPDVGGALPEAGGGMASGGAGGSGTGATGGDSSSTAAGPAAPAAEGTSAGALEAEPTSGSLGLPPLFSVPGMVVLLAMVAAAVAGLWFRRLGILALGGGAACSHGLDTGLPDLRKA